LSHSFAAIDVSKENGLVLHSLVPCLVRACDASHNSYALIWSGWKRQRRCREKRRVCATFKQEKHFQR